MYCVYRGQCSVTFFLKLHSYLPQVDRGRGGRINQHEKRLYNMPKPQNFVVSQVCSGLEDCAFTKTKRDRLVMSCFIYAKFLIIPKISSLRGYLADVVFWLYIYTVVEY